MKLSSLFGDRSFWRFSMRLALPIAIQNLLISSFSMVDTAMVSQLGDTALSSVGMAGQWAWLLNIFMFGIASGASVFFSQYWGVRDTKGIRRILGIALSVSFIFMLPFFLVALVSPSFVISLFNRDAAIIETGSAYLSVALWSYPAIALNSAVSAALRSTECVKLPMLVSGATTLFNAVLNYVFIFGVGQIPAMGVRGAALATVISTWAGPILLIAVAVLKKTVLCGSLRALFSARRDEFLRVVRRMLPVVLNEGLWGLGTWVLGLIYANLGKDEYGGVTIARTCEMIGFAFIQGLGAACCVSVGKSVGAGETENAVRDAKRFAFLVPFLSIFIGGAVLLLRAPILSLFNMSNNLSSVTLATASGMLIIYSLEIAVRNIPYIQIVGIFRSGGDTLFASIYDIGCLWLLAIPAALIAASLGVPFLGVVIIAYLCEDWPKAVFCLMRLKSLKWIKPVTREGMEGHRLFLEKRQKKI